MSVNKTRSATHMKNLFFSFDTKHPIYPLDVGWHETPPRHTYGPAVRPYFLLHLIEKGEGYIERNGEKHHLNAGNAFLIRPDEVTIYCSDANNPWEYVWIAFDGEFAKTLIERATTSLFMEYHKSGLLALKNALQDKNLDYFCCLNTLFSVLNAIKTTMPLTKSDEISDALHYLENNYFNHIDVKVLAAQFGFSRAYFSASNAQRNTLSKDNIPWRKSPTP